MGTGARRRRRMRRRGHSLERSYQDLADGLDTGYTVVIQGNRGTIRTVRVSRRAVGTMIATELDFMKEQA